jgi:uncharacterized protein YfaP (DUF2135 family)
MRALGIVVGLVGAGLVVGCTQTAGQGRDAGGARDGSAADAGTNDDAWAGDDASIDVGPRDAWFDHDAGGDAGDASALSCDHAMVTLPDPALTDGTEETMPAGCTSCPHFASLVVDVAATTAVVHGVVANLPADCTWTLVSDGCGGTTGALGASTEFGTFSRTLPLFCGTNRLQIACTNASGTTITQRTITGPSCGGRDVQITLTWGADSNDQELHLIQAPAHINDTTNDCTWFTCVALSPDWGVVGDATDNPHKDVDDTGPFGPENIFLTRAPDGQYEVMVEYWGSGLPDAPEVTITLGGRTVWRGAHTMNVHDVWDVGTLSFPASTFTPVDTITPCASMWFTGGSRGCALPIP